MNDITVTRIAAEQVLKFQSFDLSPNKLTLFRGRNGEGKTSALRLLSLCVEGSDNPRAVIHDGAKSGQITLTLSNGFTVKRSFTSKGEYCKLFDERGHEVPKPQAKLNEWLGEYRDFNPLTWIDLATSDSVEDRRRAVSILLRAIDVRITEDEFRAATGLEPPFDADFSKHGLLVLDELREHFGEERKEQNRTADQKRKAADELRVLLPAARPVLTDERRAAADQVLSEARNAKASVEARALAAKEHAAAVERLDREERREAENRARLEKEIGLLEQEMVELQQRIDRRRLQQDESSARSRELANERDSLADSGPPTPAEVDEVSQQMSAANRLLAEIADDAQILARFERVESLETEANNAAAAAAILDGTVKTITGDLRAQLMAKAKLPVGSLGLEDGRISVDGRELQFTQESQQIRVAVAIARALNPKLKTIVLDGTERLDTKTFETFLKEIHGDGFRYFAAEVDRDGGPLEIIHFGETSEGVVQQEQEAVA